MARLTPEDRTPYLMCGLEDLSPEVTAIFHDTLLPTLSTTYRAYDAVEANLRNVVSSDNTDLVGVHFNGQLSATATLNRLPILSGDGVRCWIDDVVTDPNVQRQGLSRLTMDTLEGIAFQECSEVYLTSTPDKGAAHNSYRTRGYRLLGQTPVFRNTSIQSSEIDQEPEAEQLRNLYTNKDVDHISQILRTSPGKVEGNLDRATASNTTAVFVTRGNNRLISAVAIANLCPIPVGHKPWIDDLQGYDAQSIHEVRTAAEQWVAQNYHFVNMLGFAGVEVGDDYRQRTTGLFLKQLTK